MATVAPTFNLNMYVDDSVARATWSLTTANNVGNSVAFVQHGERTVEVAGTFNGGTIVLEGSNGGQVFSNLHDPQGNVISFTANGIKQIVETPVATRPNIIANNSNNNIALTVDLLMRRKALVK